MSGAELFLLILLGLAMWFWKDTLRAREMALAASRELCNRQHFQLLDATVSMQRMELRRSPRGRVQLQRTFQFTYSDNGDSRRTGFVIVAGNHVEQVGL
jgi:hypothetical protein